MADKSKIEWTDATWNPYRGTAGRWHCTKVSEGCANCYAETTNKRFSGLSYTVGADALRLDEPTLAFPLTLKEPSMIFVNSMSDTFHEDASFEWMEKLWQVMAAHPQHTFQVLTKRPERAYEFLVDGWAPEVLPNVWLGVSAEDQKNLTERWNILKNIPAAVRWISMEPLLGLVNLPLTHTETPTENGGTAHSDFRSDVDWVVVGGESGPGAKPMNPDWVRNIRHDCAKFGVPFLFKQWGQWGIVDHKTFAFSSVEWQQINLREFMVRHASKKETGRELDGVTHDAYPMGAML